MNITRDYAAVIDDVNTQERMVTARINTAGIDRYRTVIDPLGIDLTAYTKNPVVLWEHGKDPTRGSLPIGKNTWIKTYGGKSSEIRAKTQFGKDNYSQSLFEMYRDGVLRGWSVNVLPDPKRCSPPTKEEVRARPELADCLTMYRGGELAEYSGVAVPGNADTLTVLETRGIWFPSELRDHLPDEKPDEHKEDENEDGEPDSEFRYIRKKGDQFIVYSEAGKVLGKHDSRESAVKQLQAIEAHKHNAGRSLLSIRREMADDFAYMETRLSLRLRDLSDLLKGRV